MDKLKKLGYSDWFNQRLDAEEAAIHEVARVVSVHKDSYSLTKGDGVISAELSGHMSYAVNSSSELPTTGDWVYADFYDDDTHAIIHGVLPRKTLLKRKSAGKAVDFQLIAANIDVAFIMQAVDYDFNLRRLERYLVMANESAITPVILLSKCDLLPESEVDKIKQLTLDVAPQVTNIAFSSLTDKNIESIKSYLSSGSTYCLLGSSGVGKTTLLNSIFGDELYQTQSVSRKEGKGRHTTTSRELIQLDNGALLIDTPGMRELGNISVDAGIDETFSEILALSKLCKFANCSHTKEKGCAILEAISENRLSENRYENYLKMKKESAFNELSYFERRNKDKNFGKMIKSTLKNKKR